LRRAAGIRTVEWRYPQIGIVTTVRHHRPHKGIAVEHFMRAGPFAILPMTGNRSSIVWTERAELAPRLVALCDAAFAAELAARFGERSTRSPDRGSISAYATSPRSPSW
jgi:2-octaprenyl-6-methoxyphenol hydroxylase